MPICHLLWMSSKKTKPEKFTLEIKSRRRSYEFLSVLLAKTWYMHFQWLSLTLRQLPWSYSKMPQNMKSSNRFRTVFESAVLCKLCPVPYHGIYSLELTSIAFFSRGHRAKSLVLFLHYWFRSKCTTNSQCFEN